MFDQGLVLYGMAGWARWYVASLIMARLGSEMFESKIFEEAKMVYQWKKASCIKADANIAGAMCEQLEQTVGLTAKNLLDANRAEDSPLHNEFEWDDSKAAEQYREQQARHIINSLCVCSEENNQEPVRAFFTINQPIYESLPIILQSTEKHTSLLDLALRELKAFKSKYNMLSQLKCVMEAIDECIQ